MSHSLSENTGLTKWQVQELGQEETEGHVVCPAEPNPEVQSSQLPPLSSHGHDHHKLRLVHLVPRISVV